MQGKGPLTTSTIPRLRDPLRTTRRYLGWVIVIGSLTSCALILRWMLTSWVTSKDMGAYPKNFPVLSLSFLGLMLPFLLVAWVILPHRAANAFYLRSFRNDTRSWPIRQEIQNGLGWGFRLSGIRDPRRRKSVLDYATYLVFLLRYSTVRFMNLEAAGDWKLRLSGSLVDARCVFIDVIDLTPFVAAEVELSAHCVGISRILFIVDKSRELNAWRETIAPHLPPITPPERIQLAMWDDSSGVARRQFRVAVAEFASHLPKGNAGLSESAIKFAEQLPEPDQTAYVHGASFALSAMIAPVSATGLGALFGIAMPPLEHIWQTVCAAGVVAVVAWYFLDYLIHSNHLQRWIAATAMSCCVGWFGFLSWIFIFDPAREAAQLISISSNSNRLRQVGVAVAGFYTAFGQLPATFRLDANHQSNRLLLGTPRGSHPGEGPDASVVPRHSWQTALLPYLERQELYQSISLKANWDATENQTAFQTPVEEYQAVNVRLVANPTGQALSHYAGNSLVFGQDAALRFNHFASGTGFTFVAGQAEGDFHPWGDPNNLRSPTNGVQRGPESYGCPGLNGTILLMADGSVRTVSAQIDPLIFERLGTPQNQTTFFMDDLDVPPLSVKPSPLSRVRRTGTRP